MTGDELILLLQALPPEHRALQVVRVDYQWGQVLVQHATVACGDMPLWPTAVTEPTPKVIELA